MSVHVDCQNCGNLVRLADLTSKGKCGQCGTILSLSVHGNTLSIDHYQSGRSRKRAGSKSNGNTKTKSKILKPARRLFVNFMMVMIFVSIAVYMLARFGG